MKQAKPNRHDPSEIFDDVFNHILKLYISNRLVDGEIQSIDTAYINANASIDRLVEVKMIDRDPKDNLEEVMEQDSNHNVYGHDDEQMAKKRMEKSQKSLERYKKYREEKYTEQDGGKEHRKNKRRFLSNATHMSSTDPDARIAKKSRKPRMLCYSSMRTQIYFNYGQILYIYNQAKSKSKLVFFYSILLHRQILCGQI